jgi:hypothetical protein
VVNSFWDHVIQISIRQMNFQYISLNLPNYEKLKSFVNTITPYNQTFIFEEQYCNVWPMWTFIFENDQAQIYSVHVLKSSREVPDALWSVYICNEKKYVFADLRKF